MNIPSKEALKAKYNISNNDFDILTERPPDEAIQSKGFLVKVGEVLGVQEWMWTSYFGIVLAIILIPVAAMGIYDFWQPKIVCGAEEFQRYAHTYTQPPPQNTKRWIAFYPQDTPPPEAEEPLTITHLPIGTGLYPLSGSAPFA